MAHYVVSGVWNISVDHVLSTCPKPTRCTRSVINTAVLLPNQTAGPRSAVGTAPDSQVRGPGFDTQSGRILSFLLPLIQEGHLSVTDESMCTKYWLTA